MKNSLLNLYKNLLVAIYLFDEKFSRIFTLGRTKVFKETVDVIDISGLKDRIEKFEPFIDKFFDELFLNVTEFQEDKIEHLKSEVSWSLKQCMSYLNLLKGIKGATTDANALTDPRTLAALLLYKANLQRIQDGLNSI